MATFTAPDGLLTDAVLTFSLTVTAGGVSHTDDVIITITANQAPVAEAGGSANGIRRRDGNFER